MISSQKRDCMYVCETYGRMPKGSQLFDCEEILIRIHTHTCIRPFSLEILRCFPEPQKNSQKKFFGTSGKQFRGWVDTQRKLPPQFRESTVRWWIIVIPVATKYFRWWILVILDANKYFCWWILIVLDCTKYFRWGILVILGATKFFRCWILVMMGTTKYSVGGYW